jgi:hypothetical protein
MLRCIPRMREEHHDRLYVYADNLDHCRLMF